MKIAPALYASIRDDIKAVVNANPLDMFTVAKPDSLAGMWLALACVSRDRAYLDTHPCYVDGYWKRVLPHDGREFCFYYANGCDDSHVSTALRNIKRELGL